jgi:hypothetical protein
MWGTPSTDLAFADSTSAPPNLSTQRRAVKDACRSEDFELLLTFFGKANRFRLQTGPSEVPNDPWYGSALDWIRREDYMAAKKKSRKSVIPTFAQLDKARKTSKEVRAANKRLELALRRHRDAVSPMWFVG